MAGGCGHKNYLDAIKSGANAVAAGVFIDREVLPR